MRALFIEHDHVSPPGAIGEALADHGYEVHEHLVVPEERFADPRVTTDFPDLSEVDLIVAMGAPWSAYDHELIGRWVKPELELLRQADELGIPVLGICFGGQLLALAHGGEVVHSGHHELGLTPIQTDDETLVPAGPWFQWHFDRWELPPGAQEIARTSIASQAFILRRNLAVQFHPELTTAALQGWLVNGGCEELAGRGYDPDVVLQEMADAEEEHRRNARVLTEAFLRVSAPRPSSS